jgi:hypothetical protein
MAVTITSPGLDAIIARLSSMMATLPTAMAAANETTMAEIEAGLIDRYGPHLARHWQTEMTATPALASVRVHTEDPYVYGYEYGTRAHRIQPRAKRALAFDVDGNRVVTKQVNHPGTRGKQHAAELQSLLAERALANWQDAIQTTLES